ncbi:MAG: alkaline phosphatase family protein [Planctomycetota bacterium]|nr:alkaline phosphatase family protein [Planctomycetota bacterium]
MRRVAVLNIVGLSTGLLSDATPRLREFARHSGGVRTLRPPLPAVTCTAQTAMLTGKPARDHGIVGNGWFDRGLGEVHFWKQSSGLVESPRVWDNARARAGTTSRCADGSAFTAANLFWWFNMGSTVDIAVTPRPMYPADGRKIPDVWTHPPELRDALQSKLGRFPLFHFWGPSAGISSSDWIAAAAMEVIALHRPTLSLIYLPHLDYALQRHGPDTTKVRQDLREVDRIFGVLIDFLRKNDIEPMVVSEYGIAPVSKPVYLNRVLREADLVEVRNELGREMIDIPSCAAFAVCDHQLAHVVVRDKAMHAGVRTILESTAGVEQVLDRAQQAAAGIDHERSGDFVCISERDSWFAYPWWIDDKRAPDFARTVDIHRKPGYDPCELFFDPQLLFPRLRVLAKLALRTLGMRTLLDVIPLDASLVKGSHGRVDNGAMYEPFLIVDDPMVEGPLAMESVHDVILRRLFIDEADPPHAPSAIVRTSARRHKL